MAGRRNPIREEREAEQRRRDFNEQVQRMRNLRASTNPGFERMMNDRLGNLIDTWIQEWNMGDRRESYKGEQ